MKNTPAAVKQIAITLNRRGQRVAYRYCRFGHRWFRTGLAEAELLIATEQAERVPFNSWANGKPSSMNQERA